jgi:hypothetical protein
MRQFQSYPGLSDSIELRTHPSWIPEAPDIPLHTLFSYVGHAFHSSLRLQSNVEAKLCQALHQTVSDFVAVDSIEKVCAQLLVMALMLQHGIGRHQNAVGYGHQSSFSTSPRRNAVKLGGEIRVVGMRRGPSHLTHRPP